MKRRRIIRPPPRPSFPPPALHERHEYRVLEEKRWQGKGTQGKGQWTGTERYPQLRSDGERKPPLYGERKPPLNLIVAQFVVTRDAHVRDFAWLLRETPAHVVIVVFDAVASGDEQQTLSNITKDAVDASDRFEATWFPAGAALSRRDRVMKASRLGNRLADGCTYEGFRFETMPEYMCQEAAVAVGVMYTDHVHLRLSDRFLRIAMAAVKEDNVSFVACSGLDAQLEELCGAAQALFFQPWRQGEVREPIRSCGGAGKPAVAAERWGLHPKDVGNYMVHPHVPRDVRPRPGHR